MDKWDKFVNGVAIRYQAEVNEENRPDIIEGLSKNRDRYGMPFCPCRFYDNIEYEKEHRDNVCPCKEFRMTSHCHCGLFIC